MSKLNIGITFDQRLDATQVWWGSGINQNIKFYYDLFELMGHNVVFLVAHPAPIPGQTNVTVEPIFYGEKCYRTQTYTDAVVNRIKLDLIVEAGLSISLHDNHLLREACGANIIGLRCGNPLFMDMESLFLKNEMPLGLHERGQDVMWLLPQHAKQRGFMETLHGCNSKVVPYIWEPDFVLPPNANDPLPQTPDIYVMEPNISVVKNALIPMAVIEQVYRRSPTVFGAAYILNSSEWFDQAYFLNNFVRNMTVLQSDSNKTYFSGRHRFSDVMQKKAVLLGFQIENELNYLYHEALHYNLPFVHNSPAYEEVGYFYPEYDVFAAADQVINAIEDKNHQQNAQNNRRFLQQFSIRHQPVQDRYTELLDEAVNIN